jgi:membrane-bound lytic murein transglycosylase D
MAGQDSLVAEGNSLLKLRTAIDRVQQLRPAIEPILRSEGVPVELSAVVLVESGGLPSALSPKGARGVWQFMPDTARRYGLVVDGGRDDRTDVIKSTHAAARYLRDLHARFRDWSLALAAYNAGELAVTNAMSRVPSRDFRSLSDSARLPTETRRYVPAVNAAMNRLYYQSSSIRIREVSGKEIVYATSGSGE